MSEASEPAQPPSGTVSPEQRCPICLEDFEDKAFINACFHPFCFACIVQWSEVTNSCPMCKTTFQSIIHNIKSNDDYTKFEIIAKPTPSHQEVSLTEARRFRYGTTRIARRPGPARHYVRQNRKPAIEERRKAVYLAGLRALPLEAGERRQRIRNITAAFFRENPAASHRLFPWLSREFKVLLGQEHVEFMIQIVMSLLDKVDLESEDFASHLEPFLHEKTAHFMHELLSFARSPYDMIAYDGRVSYDWPGSSAPGRENWGPESALNVPEHSGQAGSGPSPGGQPNGGSSPGPSGPSSAANMQRRILEELTTARWDDSPPILPSSSPIVIHGSDSEQEEYGARSPFHDHQPPTHDSQPLLTDNVEPSSSDGMEPQFLQNQIPVTEVNDTSSEIQLQSHTGSSAAADIACGVSSTTKTIASLPSTREQMKPETAMANPGSSLTCNQEHRIPEESFISIHAENVGELDFSSASTASFKGRSSAPIKSEVLKHEQGKANVDKGKGKGKGRGRSEHTRSEDKKTSRFHSDDDQSFLESEVRKHSSRHSKRSHHNRHDHRPRQRRHRRSPSYSSDSDHSFHGSRRKHGSRERRSHTKLKRKRSPPYSVRHHPEKTYGDHDYERCTDAYSAVDVTYYQRERQLHRSRLYSDDYPRDGASSRVSREHKSFLADTEPSSPDDCRHQNERRKHQYSSKEKKKRDDGSRCPRDRSRESHRSGNQDGSGREKGEKQAEIQLSQELSELEGQIKDSKKQLLKSFLRRERLEFLHKALKSEKLRINAATDHTAEECSHQSIENICPPSTSGDSTADDMVKELVSLDRAIDDGKKQILRVMRRMEEQQAAVAEEDTDSS